MIKKEVHIEQLMLEKLTGMISQEASHYLDSLLESDEEVYAQWEEIKKNFNGDPHNYLQKLNEDDAWDHVKEGIRVRWSQRRRRIRTLAIAASLLLLAVAAGLIFYPVKTPSGFVRTEQKNKDVKLYIGGSRAINLSQYKDTLTLPTLNNISLKIGNGNLSYIPAKDRVDQDLNTLVIPVTKTYKITLSDGTEVTLNSISQLEFPFTFSESKREVWLNGEAYFRVVKDDNRPFIVHTPLTDIIVLGTEFNVNTYDSLTVYTSLVEGAVSTHAANGESIELKPGYEAIFSKAKGFNIKAFDRNNLLSWIHGIYYFQNTPLKDIVPVIHRWYGATLIFDDQEVSSLRFTGAVLKNSPLRDFLDNLSLTSKIKYSNKGGVIHISTMNLRK